MPRLHWSFDGSLLYKYHPTTHELVELATYQRNILDSDPTPSTSVAFGDTYNCLISFPTTIRITKVGFRNSAAITGVYFYVSPNSTDGYDGDWYEIHTVDYTPAYSYQLYNMTITDQDAKWLKIHRAYPGIGNALICVHVFGDYQSPLYQLCDTGGTPFTDDYPFEMADAPNDDNYLGNKEFKIKNLDSVSHSYTVTIHYMAYGGDDIITDYFKVSADDGDTKTTSINVGPVSASGLSDTIDVYGVVLRTFNPANGRHYFWIDVVQQEPPVDDIFEGGTQQDMIVGGDGEKLYGWNMINTANIEAADVNITNAGMMTLEANNFATDITANVFTAPFVFQQVTGDFDVEIYISSINANASYECCGIVVSDPAESPTYEDWCGIFSGYWSNASVWSRSSDVGDSLFSSTDHKYLRLVREGTIIRTYTKANPGDSWLLRATYDRSGFHPTVQLGIVIYTKNSAATLVAQVDYFRNTV